jgi:hypothetical protein
MIEGNLYHDPSQAALRKRGYLGIPIQNRETERNKFVQLEANKPTWIGECNQNFKEFHDTGLSTDQLARPNLNQFLSLRGLQGYIEKPILEAKDFGSSEFLQNQNYYSANYRDFANIITDAGRTAPLLYGPNASTFFDPQLEQDVNNHLQDVQQGQDAADQSNQQVDQYNQLYAGKLLNILGANYQAAEDAYNALEPASVTSNVFSQFDALDDAHKATSVLVAPQANAVVNSVSVDQQLIDKLQQKISGNIPARNPFEAPKEFYKRIQQGFYPYNQAVSENKYNSNFLAAKYENKQYENLINEMTRLRKSQETSNYFDKTGPQHGIPNTIIQRGFYQQKNGFAKDIYSIPGKSKSNKDYNDPFIGQSSTKVPASNIDNSTKQSNMKLSLEDQTQNIINKHPYQMEFNDLANDVSILNTYFDETDPTKVDQDSYGFLDLKKRQMNDIGYKIEQHIMNAIDFDSLSNTEKTIVANTTKSYFQLIARKSEKKKKDDFETPSKRLKDISYPTSLRKQVKSGSSPIAMEDNPLSRLRKNPKKKVPYTPPP